MPRSIMFSAFWIEDASAGLTLSQFVKWPAGWKKRPNIYALYSWSRYSTGENDVILQTPSWSPNLWPSIKANGFIFIRYVGNDLERIESPVRIFGRDFQPMRSRPTEALKLTPLGAQIMRADDRTRWISVRHSNSYGVPLGQK